MKTYYVLTLLSTGSGEPETRWTFSTRDAALQHVYNTGLCDGCKQDVATGYISEYIEEADATYDVVINDALDTACGAHYRIEEITEQMYRERAEAALQEMQALFASEYNQQPAPETPAEGAD